MSVRTTIMTGIMCDMLLNIPPIFHITMLREGIDTEEIVNVSENTNSEWYYMAYAAQTFYLFFYTTMLREDIECEAINNCYIPQQTYKSSLVE